MKHKLSYQCKTFRCVTILLLSVIYGGDFIASGSFTGDANITGVIFKATDYEAWISKRTSNYVIGIRG